MVNLLYRFVLFFLFNFLQVFATVYIVCTITGESRLSNYSNILHKSLSNWNAKTHNRNPHKYFRAVQWLKNKSECLFGFRTLARNCC